MLPIFTPVQRFWLSGLGLVAGILALQSCATLPSLGALLALLPICLICWSLHARFPRLAWVLLGFSLGAAWALCLAHQRMADRLPKEWEGKAIEIEATLVDLPDPTAGGVRIKARVDQVLTRDAQVPSLIQLSLYGDPTTLPVFAPGQRWQFGVKLRRPHGNANPHGFDFEAWMLEQSLRAVGSVRHYRQLAGQGWSPLIQIHLWRQALRDRMAATLGERPYAGVLIALVMGDQRAIPQSQWDKFNQTGVTHLVSISGLHITLVAGLVGGVVYRLWRSLPLAMAWPARKAAVLAGLIAACWYALLGGFSVPTQRTLWMLLVAAIALWRGRAIHISSMWLMAALICLLIDPWAVMAPGFWLSFGAIGCIMWAAANRLQRPHWLVEWGRTQWAVTLGLAPALLAYFSQLPLLSPLANAFAIPVVGAVVTPLALLGSIITPLLTLAHAILTPCMQALGWLAGLPGSLWQQPAPHGWAIWLAMPGIAWCLLPTGWPARGLGCLLLLPLIASVDDRPQPEQLRITFIDVGQGLAVWVQTARHDLLYDTGPSFQIKPFGPRATQRIVEDATQLDAGNRVILPRLRAAGVSRLHGLIVSHDDLDHTGGAASIIQALPPDWVMGSLPPHHPITTQAKRYVGCRQHLTWQWDGVRFAVLAPDAATLASPTVKDNDRSCVLLISCAGGRVLLTGDLERWGELTLLESNTLPTVQVLSVGHHGSNTSSSEPFLAATQAQIAVVSAGYMNRFGHPTAKVLARLKAQGSAVARTDQDGEVSILLEPTGIQLQRYRQARPRYWDETDHP
ncbi:competence protein ComEC [Chitinivorax tropicus]|uniref:Competence protein ComEC n=1 Tax=Chitinivorax tropicus TaxID=714531 RepID=A0A840MJ48_9PROT|nr:DNA internalization-related competence protein ComEC/Rec2 [Chitinivorax tropicus]MBB5016807.1 competence protein ComEC [Chitinivorax tropicus]